MNSFTVTRSSRAMVRPSVSTPSGSLKLSVIDRAPMLRFHVRILHVFKDGNHKSAKIIRDALSKALVYYYPLAGRLKESSDVELHLSCTGEGIWFVEGSANCALAAVNYMDDAPLHAQEMLLPDSIPETMGLDPIVLMQVTSFKCGGFVIGLMICHSVCDGAGASQFLAAISEFARGKERLTIEPVWFRETIPSPSPIKSLVSPPPPPPPLMPHYQLKHASFDIPGHKIDHLKRELSSLTSNSKTTYSTFEILTASLWRSRTRAINLHGSSIVKLIFYANIRRLLNPPPPQGFYGNCIFPVTVTVSSGWLVEASLLKVVELVKETKEKLPLYFKEWIYSNKGGLDEDLVMEEPFTAPLDYATLCMSDIQKLDMDSIDFGWGHPLDIFPVELSHVMGTHPFGFLCAPPRPKTGIRLKTWCVEEAHLRSLHDELMETLKFNSSN